VPRGGRYHEPVAESNGSSARVFDDLRAEQDRLEAILSSLDDTAWRSPSAAPTWSVADVVLHLAISEEMVLATLAAGDATARLGASGAGAAASAAQPGIGGMSVDEAMDAMVRAERADPPAVFERWRAARHRAGDALAAADPARPLAWAAAPLRPVTLATTRLAEHWAHGIDITEPLGIAFEDTSRLRHVVWLAHRTLPYALSLAGLDSVEVRFVLDGVDGDAWVFGSDAAESEVSGPAGDLCRVAAQRMPAERSRLVTTGPHGDRALALVRTYAA